MITYTLKLLDSGNIVEILSVNTEYGIPYEGSFIFIDGKKYVISGIEHLLSRSPLAETFEVCVSAYRI